MDGQNRLDAQHRADGPVDVLDILSRMLYAPFLVSRDEIIRAHRALSVLIPAAATYLHRYGHSADDDYAQFHQDAAVLREALAMVSSPRILR